jgi:hypothetical protein
MAKQKQSQSTDNIAGQFSDEEMEQLKRYGAAQLGGTDFSEAVERELEKLQRGREASTAKMRTAQMGLAPSKMETAQVQQTGAMQQGLDVQSQAQATRAQAQQTQPTPPPAPGGPQGVTQPYAAEAKTPPGPGNMPSQQGPTPDAPSPQEDQEEPEG